MAEPGASPAKPDKKGSLLKKKVAGIPMPVILVVAGVGIFYLYKKYKANQPASTSSTATPTASSGTPTDTSGGYTGGYSSGGGYTGSGGYTDPNAAATTANQTSPTDTSSLTSAPTSSANLSNITPTGNRTITIGGKSYSTVSGFMQNGNQYLGVDNPAEAKRLTAAGVHLVQNPNDPNGKGEFILIPKGAKGPVIRKPPAKKAPAKKKAPVRG